MNDTSYHFNVGAFECIVVSDGFFLEQPDWYVAVEPTPEQAVASRRQLLAWAVTENALVHAFHFAPFPSLGHVVEKGKTWQWQPVEVTG